jgi:Protein of unknown function (DUF3150)
MSEPIIERKDGYKELFRDGSLLHLHIRSWPMRAPLEWDDLRRENGEELPWSEQPDNIYLGTKRLMPVAEIRRFNHLERKARVLLEQASFKFPIAQLHFVPNRRLPRLTAALWEARREFEAEADAFAEGYVGRRNQMLADHPDQADRLRPHYPPPEKIRRKFSFELQMIELALPRRLRDLDSSRIRARMEAEDRMRQRFEAELEAQYWNSVNQIRSFVASVVDDSRQRIIEAFEGLGRRLAGGEVVTERSLDRVRRFLDAFDEISFIDDGRITAEIASVRGLLAAGAGQAEDRSRLSTAVGRLLTAAHETCDVDQVAGSYLRRMNLDAVTMEEPERQP